MYSGNARQAAWQYQRAQVETARPTQLIIMLYDGALRFLMQGREMMQAGDIEGRHTNLLKAQRIISELLSTLDEDRGGEVAENLKRLYFYMLEQLVQANLHDSVKPIDAVIQMLRELRASWVQVDQIQQTEIVEEQAVG